MKHVVLYVVAALLAGCGGSGNHHVFGKLSKVTGTALVFGSANGKWIPAESGASVRTGDSIRTSKESEAVVSFGDNTITLSENTCITIADTVDGQNKRLIAVLDADGEVLSDVKDAERRGAQYEVWTPTAVAHAEGTHFAVVFSPDPYVTNVRVLDGRVRVFNPFVPSAPPVLVSPGCYTRIAYNAAPVAAVPMNYRQFKKMQRIIEPRRYQNYEREFKINPDEMAMDAPIVTVSINTPPIFLPPPLPRGPHGRIVMTSPFLLPPGPGMPLPRPPHGGMIAPMPPLPPGLPLPPLPGPGRIVVSGPVGPMPAPHDRFFKVERGSRENDRGDWDDDSRKGKHKDRKHK